MTAQEFLKNSTLPVACTNKNLIQKTGLKDGHQILEKSHIVHGKFADFKNIGKSSSEKNLNSAKEITVSKFLTKYNYSERNTAIKYIVVHDTGNYRVGANALAHAKYFGSGNKNASAHYFVDDKNIVQIVEDYNASWHCGDGRGKFGITNANSIGIEICVNADSDFEVSLSNTVLLILSLMKKYSISPDRVVRHFDASGKICPKSMSKNNWEKWKIFKNYFQNRK